RADGGLRALQGHRPAGGRDPRGGRSLHRRLRPERWRGRRDLLRRRGGAVAARSPGRPRVGEHGLVLRRFAESAELYPSPGVPGSVGSGGAPERPSRRHRGVATAGSGAVDGGTPARSLGGLEYGTRFGIVAYKEQAMVHLSTLSREGLKTDIPNFAPGDTVKVMVRVREGEKERLQAFEGVCVARRGGGIDETFTVRKIS